MNFTRRPHLQGNTNVPVHSQPSIRGHIPKDPATGLVTGLGGTPKDLVVTTVAGTATVTLASASMTAILADLNAGLVGASASERDGCLVLTADASGAGAFIRIEQTTNDHDADNRYDDAAPFFGLPQHPDLLATVTAGDFLPAATRASTEGNPEGTRLLAGGEDRTSVAYNRALAQLGLNDDYLVTLLSAPVAVPTVVVLQAADGRFVYDVNGNIEQVNLSALEGMNPDWSGRIFVGGGLTGSSSLRDISHFFRVTDTEGKELLAWDDTWAEPRRAVRVACVTRGQRVAPTPTFSSETSAPGAPLGDTATSVTPWAVDGLNALGVNRVKVPNTQILGIVRKTGIVCDITVGEGFTGDPADPDGARVVAGDLATISGSTVVDPFNHDGTYIVEQVISAGELVLRPGGPTNLRGLNDEGVGNLGGVIVSSGGEWEKEIFITLDPPITRLPPDGKLRFVIGLEQQLGAVLSNSLVSTTVEASSEVAAFVVRQLWNRQSLGGAYSGMGNANGGGFFAEAEARPATFMRSGLAFPSEGTGGASYTGDLEGGILVADPAMSFAVEDVGKLVRVSGAAGYLNNDPFIIVEFIDGSHVRVLHGSGRLGATLPDAAAFTYQVYSDSQIDLPAAVHALSRPGGADEAGLGFLFTREQDTGGTGHREGRGFTHLERQTHGKAPTLGTDILSTAVTAFPGGAGQLTIAFNPELADNLRTQEGSTTKSVEGYRVPTFVRVLNGPYMGWYRLQTTTDAGVLTLVNLDGTAAPAFANPGYTVYLGFYNVTFGSNVPMASGVQAAVVAVNYGRQEALTFAPALYVDWTGPGAGIYSVLNDPEFTSLNEEQGAEGYHTYVKGYAPAHGAYYELFAKTNGADDERGARAFTAVGNSWFLDLVQLADPLVEVADPDGWAGWFHQAGRDPALVVTRGAGYSGGTPGENPVSLYGIPVAALVVQAEVEDAPSSYFGGAADVLGSVLLRTGASGNPSNLQVSGSVAVGDTVWSPYPYRALMSANHEYADGTFVPRLGLPSQVFPISSASSAVVGASLGPPDYSMFDDIPHHAVLSTTDADVGSDLSTQHLGAGVLLSTNEGYTLAGFAKVAGTTYMALLADVTGSVYAGAPSVVDFTVRGRRWSGGAVDTAHWMLVGTGIEIYDNYKLPWLTIGTPPDDTPTFTPLLDPTVLEVHTHALFSRADFAPAVEGKGVGHTWDLSGYAIFQVTSSAFEADSAYENHRWATGWQRVSSFVPTTQQPRSAFPNDGLFTGGDAMGSAGILDSGNPGNLLTDDYALEHVAGTAGSARWSEVFGGAVTLRHVGVGAASTLRLWQRGALEFAPDLHAVRARALVWIGGTGTTRDVTLALRKGDGTLLASAIVSVAGLGSGATEPTVVEELFTSDTLVSAAADALEENTLVATGVHLTLDVGVTSTDSLPGANAPGVHVITMGAEPVARPHRVSALDVAGPLRFSTLRTLSSIRGFETVGPQSADLLNSSEYAKLYADDDGSAEGLDLDNEVGSQEGRGTGLVLTTEGANTHWYQPHLPQGRFFQKGRNTASLAFHHPYFDPLWYAECTVTGGTTLNPERCVLPGRTGFIVPVNPPHGSLITSLYHLASVRPAYRNFGGVPVKDFQLWHSHPAKSDSWAVWEDPTEWSSRKGYRLRLWRHSSLNFGQAMERLTTHFSGHHRPSYGFCEPIWEGTVSLSDSDAPDFTHNTDFATEYFIRDSRDLCVKELPGSGKSHLRVDRRHYSYFVTFEMWGGCRTITGATYSYSGLDTMFHSQEVTSYGAGLTLSGSRLLHPETADDALFTWPSVFKFRGLRLGWVTDRPGHGGWG